MTKVSTYQPVVYKEVKAGRWGDSDRTVTVIDEKKTYKNIQTWLKRKKVVKPIYINLYDEKREVNVLEDYPIELKVVGDSYYSKGSKQYRVYVKEGYKTIRFVQSSKDGVLNMDKLVALVTEMVEDNNAKEERDWKAEQDRKSFDSLVADANKKLKGSGFRLES